MIELPYELKKIFSDNTSGSRELLLKLNNALKISFNSIEEKEKLFNLLLERFSEFSTIVDYLKNLRKEYEIKGSVSEKFFADFLLKNEDVARNIYSKLKPYLKNFKKILTLSNSLTVSNILMRHFNEAHNFEVFVSESRPILEGQKMAELLADYGVKVTLITEAMLAQKAMECDAGIIGADKIFPDGSILNKTGSLTLAIVLRYFKKPLFVVADKSKRTGEMNLRLKQYPPEEIYSGEKKVINITNFYFERIDEILITKLLTD